MASRHAIRSRPVSRPDDSLQVRRRSPEARAWMMFAVTMAALLAAAVIVSALLGGGWGFWAVMLLGMVVIGSLISLAVVPSIRKR